jgi:hypothetical protein
MRFVFLIVTLMFACQREVMKLQSAEAEMKFEEAKKYIDVASVFRNYPNSQDPEREWRESVTFFYNIGNTKKFTNRFRYYNYDILESVNSNNAEVRFVATNKTAHLKEIVYSLRREDESWRVVEIEYKK